MIAALISLFAFTKWEEYTDSGFPASKQTLQNVLDWDWDWDWDWFLDWFLDWDLENILI
jgi:hypothetical protein